MISEAELGYIAGYIDADGSISVHSSSYHHRNYSIHVQIVSVKLESLLWIQERFPGKITSSTPKPKHHKVQHNLQYWGHNCKPILVAVKPFLVLKKLQAGVALEFIETLNPNDNKGAIKKLSEEILEVREFLMDEMKILNGTFKMEVC